MGDVAPINGEVQQLSVDEEFETIAEFAGRSFMAFKRTEELFLSAEQKTGNPHPGRSNVAKMRFECEELIKSLK